MVVDVVVVVVEVVDVVGVVVVVLVDVVLVDVVVLSAADGGTALTAVGVPSPGDAGGPASERASREQAASSSIATPISALTRRSRIGPTVPPTTCARPDTHRESGHRAPCLPVYGAADA